MRDRQLLRNHVAPEPQAPEEPGGLWVTLPLRQALVADAADTGATARSWCHLKQLPEGLRVRLSAQGLLGGVRKPHPRPRLSHQGQGTGGHPTRGRSLLSPEQKSAPRALGLGLENTFLSAKVRGWLPLRLSLQEGKSAFQTL